MKAVDNAIYRAKKKHGYILFVEENDKYIICRLPNVRELEAATSVAIFRNTDRYFMASLLFDDIVVERSENSESLRYDMEEKIAEVLPINQEEYKTFEDGVLEKSQRGAKADPVRLMY